MDNWTRGRVIGRGSSATVSLAKNSTTGELIAVKSSHLKNSHHHHHHHHHHLETEQAILSSLPPSPYIITYKGHSNNNNIFMEYLPRGSLSSELTRRLGGSLINNNNSSNHHHHHLHQYSLLQIYTWRILNGLQHLHSNGIVHCDIKPSNLLMTSTGPKIADFGCARHVSSSSSSSSSSSTSAAGRFSGTPLYMAPEVARGEEQGFASDIWSLGCTVIEMVTGKPPWRRKYITSEEPVSFLYGVGYGLIKPEVPEELLLCVDGRDFVDKCLRRDACERWTARELLQHPFIKDVSVWNHELEIDIDITEEMKDCDQMMSKNCSVSPTSVLEQQQQLETMWSLDSPHDSSGDSMMTSVEVRISGLVSSSMHKWEFDDDDDEDWITVRNQLLLY